MLLHLTLYLSLYQIKLLMLLFFFSDLFYVRNHLPVPETDIKNYKLELAIEDTTKKTLDFEKIKKYKKHTITAAIMCGGNRRSEMTKVNLNKFLIKMIASNLVPVLL